MGLGGMAWALKKLLEPNCPKKLENEKLEKMTGDMDMDVEMSFRKIT